MTEADGQLAQARPSAAARVLMTLITGYRRFVSPLLGAAVPVRPLLQRVRAGSGP